MRISTRGRYALRLMLDLATNYTGKPIRLKDVAKRQEISDKYLEQIISILNKAGFVRSVRGPQGGYALQQTPDKYTVGMILRLTEGSLSPVECLDDNGAICDREENCVTQILWKAGRCYQRCGGSYNIGRPDELAIREGGRVHHIKKTAQAAFFYITFFY